MSRNSKRRKKILKEFESFSDDELRVVLTEAIKDYVVLSGSEKKAREILLKYDMVLGSSMFDRIEYRYNCLLELAELRNINISDDWYDIEIPDEEIIARIDEFKWRDLRWIEEHSYLMDSGKALVCVNIDDNFYGLESDRETTRISLKYDEIISKEFGKKFEYDAGKVLKKINNSYLGNRRGDGADK